VALAPAIGYFLSPEIAPGPASLILALMFAATLVGRPLRALIFGHLADRGGRKRATLIAVGGFGALTVVIGLLPGYETLGMTAVVLFVALRFIVGIFVGGEYTAASPLAMESAPKHRRGLYGALIMTGFPLAFVTMSLLTLLMLEIAPADGLDSPYVQWGWRTPFIVGGILHLLRAQRQRVRALPGILDEEGIPVAVVVPQGRGSQLPSGFHPHDRFLGFS
jgi:MFS family permease